jgi:hypothetical protein
VQDEPDPAVRDQPVEPPQLDALKRRVEREGGHDRGADPGGRERAQQRVVLRPQHDPRLHAVRAQVALDHGVGSALAVGDEVELAEVLERRLAERAALRQDEHVRVAQERNVCRRSVALLVGDREREVEHAALDLAVELVVRAGLQQRELDPRPGRAELGQQRGEQARGDALVGADPQLTRGALGQGVDVGRRRLQPRQDRARMAEQDAAGLGQDDRARAARALEHARADHPLDHHDLLADGRRRVAELVGGAVERPVTGDGVERGEVAQLEAQLIRPAYLHP